MTNTNEIDMLWLSPKLVVDICHCPSRFFEKFTDNKNQQPT